jgi:hypothetical protein
VPERLARALALISMKWRLSVFAIVTAVVFVILYSMPGLNLFAYPFPTYALGSGCIGPILFLTIPATLGWASFAAPSRRQVIIGVTGSILLFLFLALVIWNSQQVVHWLYVG